MKLDEFITTVLTDVEAGIKNAKSITGKDYCVDQGNERGIRFDIAVTTSESTSNSVDGKASAGFIQVLGAGIEAKSNGTFENSKVSRIQFLVDVPKKTKADEDAEIRDIQNQNELNREHWGIK